MIYTAIFLLFIVVIYEYMRGRMIQEGFTDGDRDLPEFFTRFFPRRYDVVPGQTEEAEGWVRNTRYFEGYVDVQRFGYKADFCRVVEKPNDPDSRIMTCALAGQEGLDSLTYRTDSARSGLKFSRDDYFHDLNGDKRDDYCRVLKVANSPNDAWEARCVPAGITRFKQGVEIQDLEPPKDISDILWFYEGIMVWYRLFDDILDYAENTHVKLAGDITIDETPQRKRTDGLGINRLVAGGDAATQAAEQFIRIGENPRMEFDSVVDLRQLRAVSTWVYFDDFTNNARIFDFGNGPGKDNVFLGIQGKGNRNTGKGVFGNVGARPNPSNLVCQAKAPEEVSPFVYMKTTDANVDEWTCPAVEPIDSAFPEDEGSAVNLEAAPLTANLLFEIWDSSQRKMRIVVPDVVTLKRWFHVTLTTTNMDLVMPTWTVYIDGDKVFEHLDGHLPLKSYTTRNYIGRSNWENVTKGYQDRDERFRGALFDFRMYRAPMAPTKIARTVAWGRERLQITERGVREKDV